MDTQPAPTKGSALTTSAQQLPHSSSVTSNHTMPLGVTPSADVTEDVVMENVDQNLAAESPGLPESGTSEVPSGMTPPANVIENVARENVDQNPAAGGLRSPESGTSSNHAPRLERVRGKDRCSKCHKGNVFHPSILHWSNIPSRNQRSTR
jgi:hypothetical protein